MLAKALGWAAPEVIATTGWKTYELIEAAEAASLKPSYDWVSLLIGVNNQYRQIPFQVLQDDLHRLGTLMLSRVRKPGQIFLVSIPDYSVTPFVEEKDRARIAGELLAYNDYLKEYALKKGFQFCYITDISQKAGEDTGLIVEDKLHPSARQYQMWVNRIIQSCDF